MPPHEGSDGSDTVFFKFGGGVVYTRSSPIITDVAGYNADRFHKFDMPPLDIGDPDARFRRWIVVKAGGVRYRAKC